MGGGEGERDVVRWDVGGDEDRSPIVSWEGGMEVCMMG